MRILGGHWLFYGSWLRSGMIWVIDTTEEPWLRQYQLNFAPLLVGRGALKGQQGIFWVIHSATNEDNSLLGYDAVYNDIYRRFRGCHIFLTFFNFLTLFATLISFSPSTSVSPVSLHFCCHLLWRVKPTALLTPQHNLPLAFLGQSPKMFFILPYGTVSSTKLSIFRLFWRWKWGTSPKLW